MTHPLTARPPTTEPTAEPTIDLTPASWAGDPFAVATTVTATDEPGAFTALLHPDWSVAGRPNGGYLAAVLGRAATATAQQDAAAGLESAARPSGVTSARAILAASTHFLRPPGFGRVQIEVVPMHTGRTTTQLRARLSQDGRACVESMLTLGELRASVPATWTGVGPRPTADPWDECLALHPDPAVFPVPLLDQVELRLSPATVGWTHGRPTGRGELTGWLALPHGVAFDPVSLLFAVDAFPPATFDVQMSGWVPTLQLSTYVRAVPVPGPVQILHRAHTIADGRVDETCLVWDRAGTLVAQSTQLAGIRLG